MAVALRLVTELTEADDPVVAAVQVALRMDKELLGSELATAREIQTSLEQARLEIIGKLALVDKDWQRWQLEAVLRETETQMQAWDQRTRSTVQTALTDSAVKGETLALETLDAGGQPQPYLRPTLGFAHLTAQFAYSADLIKGVSQSTITKVNTELRRAAMALDSPLEVMRRLGPVTGKGTFASAFHRAEAITRTEMGRSYSASNHATQLELKKLNPGLGKKWLAVVDMRTRPAHIAANDQFRKLEEPYTVDGEHLLYPKDPNGSAANTINCRCVSMPWHPAWDEPLPADQPVEPEINPRVQQVTQGTVEFQQYAKDLNDFIRRYQQRMNQRDASGIMPPFAETESKRWEAEYNAIRDRLDTLEKRFRQLAQFGLSPTNLSTLSQADVDEIQRLVREIRGTTPAGFGSTTYGGDLYTWSAYNSLSFARTTFADQLAQIATRWQIGSIPLADRIAPRPIRAGLKQTAYDISFNVATELERLGYRTTWNGGVGIGGAGRGSAAYYGAGGDVVVSSKVSRYTTSNQYSLLLHEQFHGVSEYYGSGSSSTGWEEGVVEMMSQLSMPAMKAAYGLDTLGYQSYGRFTQALELLRGWIDMAPEEFYPTLIRMPSMDRAGWVARHLPPDMTMDQSILQAQSILELGPSGGR